MKPLTKRILEAGLVDKHAAKMFESWGQLEPGDSDLVGRKMVTETGLRAFIDDIEQLTEPDDEMKETRLDIRVTQPPVTLLYVKTGNYIAAIEDEMGRFLIGSAWGFLVPGEVLRIAGEDEDYWTIEQVEPLYQGDDLIAYQITVDKGQGG